MLHELSGIQIKYLNKTHQWHWTQLHYKSAEASRLVNKIIDIRTKMENKGKPTPLHLIKNDKVGSNVEDKATEDNITKRDNILTLVKTKKVQQ